MVRWLCVALLSVCPGVVWGGVGVEEYEEAVEGWEELEGGLVGLYREDEGEGLLAAIPEDVVGAPLFLATSVVGGSEYSGWQWSDALLRFERFHDRLLLVEMSVRERAEEGSPLSGAVGRTYSDRVLADMEILGVDEGGRVLVDLGEVWVGEYSTFFGGTFRLNTGLARLRGVEVFPENVEVSIEAPLSGSGVLTTVHYSLSRLPEEDDYEPREADDRVGYFLTAVRDYTGGDPREGRMVRWINRWKLRKADPSLELSPPEEPIVFYVEDTVPYAYRRAVAEGILAWNEAFEALGIVGAIEVRQQTATQFQDVRPEDVRFNFFRWITSETPFAMGPSRVDPRTGRILDADIIFDDSMLRTYQEEADVFVERAALGMMHPSTRARLERRPELHPLARWKGLGGDPWVERLRGVLGEVAPGLVEVEGVGGVEAEHRECGLGGAMGHELGLAGLRLEGRAPGLRARMLEEVVRETVMHEVGHTLGLRHNFKASSWLGLEAVNGGGEGGATSASVMDYHPLNLAAGEEEQGPFLPQRIGPYDRLAIEYGYGLEVDLGEVAGRMAAEGLPYGTDEDTGSPDPRITRWDMGADPVAFAAGRRAVVLELWEGLEDTVVADGESYRHLRWAFERTLSELGRSSLFVARVVGGMSFARDHRGDPGAREPIVVLPAAEQRRALEWLGANLFAADAFPLDRDLLSKLAASRWSHWGSSDRGASLDYPVLDRIQQIQSWALFALTADETLARIWESETFGGQEDPLTLPELFETLEGALFGELEGEAAGVLGITAARQNLQDAYVRRLVALTLNDSLAPPVASKLAWSRLAGLEASFGEALERSLDPYTRAHLQALKVKSNAAREAQYVHLASGGGCALGSDAGRASGWLWLLMVGLVGLRVRRGGSRG